MAFARNHEGRIWNLVEILRIYADAYAKIVSHLDTSVRILEERDVWQDHEFRAHLMGELEELTSMCADGELSVTNVLVTKTLHSLKQGEQNEVWKHAVKNQLVKDQLYDIKNRFIDELSTKLFFQLSSVKREYYDNPQKGWGEVVSRFPETGSEITEMSRCFALSRYPASIFHAMQAIEAVLIHLGAFLLITDTKSGWTAVCKALERIVHRTKYPDLKDYEKRHFAFLQQVQGTAESLNSAWRNKISHTMNRLVLLPGDCSPDVAQEIMVASRSFMRRL